jgi:uncharacterized membrane-anchored protein
MLRKSLRTLAWIFVVWGVATCAVWIFYLPLGIATVEQVLPAEVGGGILIAVGYLLERKTRRKPANQQDGDTASPPS